jgi:hypothetical protein
MLWSFTGKLHNVRTSQMKQKFRDFQYLPEQQNMLIGQNLRTIITAEL